MDNAARVWIEWTDLLRCTGRLGLVGKKPGHLPELFVLAFSEAERVDDVVTVATLVAFSSPISAGERTFLPNMLPFPNASGPWDDALPRIVTLQPR